MAVTFSGPVTVVYGWRNVTTGEPWPSTYTYYGRQYHRTDRVKRPKPPGIEILFNGTVVSYTKISAYYGVAYRGFTLYGQDYQEGILVPPAFRGTTGSVLITSDDWANTIRSKLKDQSVNLAQAYAERKQTASMFVDFGSRILKAYKALRKFDPSGVYRALSGGKTLPRGWKKKFSHSAQLAGDHWLAWQYGIRPLISDIAGSVEEIYKVRSVQPLIRRVTHKVRKRSYDNTVAVNPTNFTGFARIVANAEFDSGASGFDQTAQRLGLTDPVMLAWELIPYSFVIDWFLNVGDFLHAAGTISGLKRCGISVTETYTISAVNSDATYGGLATYDYKSVSRTFTGTIPGPTMVWSKTPFGRVDLGAMDRVYSALALARQPLGTSTLPSRRG